METGGVSGETGAVRPREGEGEVLEGKVLIGIRCYLHSKKYNRTGKVAHWVRMLVAKPDDLRVQSFNPIR